MEKYFMDGEEYTYRNGKWLDSRYTIAPLAVANKLNQLLIKNTDFEAMSIEELLKIIDGSRKSDNIQLAAQVLETAIRKASVDEIRKLLPRLTSNYRKLGRPQTAIDISKIYTDEYKKKVWSPALFTSIAAAYCDIDDYEVARKFANLARSISGQEASVELVSVYKRIKEAEK